MKKTQKVMMRQNKVDTSKGERAILMPSWYLFRKSVSWGRLMGFKSVFFSPPSLSSLVQPTSREPEKSADKGGWHLTMSKGGFVPRTSLVNGVPFNQGATRENHYTFQPIYNSTLWRTQVCRKSWFDGWEMQSATKWWIHVNVQYKHNTEEVAQVA